MSFVRRKIDLTFQLGQGNFGESGFNTVTLSGLRASASISKAGGLSMPSLHLLVYGMTESQMNQLSMLSKPLVGVRYNSVQVDAGDDESGMSTVFLGTITESWFATEGMPQVGLNLVAVGGLIPALKPVAPNSYQGSADAAVIMASLAAQMGYAFQNNGVTTILSNPYLPGTARDQAYAVARAGDFHVFIDDASPTAGPSSALNASPDVAGSVLAIWPKGGSRGGAIPLVSPDTGMVGYPTATQNAIRVKMLFNPNIVYGGLVKVESAIRIANSTWYVFSVEHELVTETPGGAWFTTIEGSVLGQPVPLG